MKANFRSIPKLAVLAAITLSSTVFTAQAAPVVVTDLYGSYVETPGVGITFSNYDGYIGTNDIQFYTDNGGMWFPSQVPFAEPLGFGANITTELTSLQRAAIRSLIYPMTHRMCSLMAF